MSEDTFLIILNIVLGILAFLCTSLLLRVREQIKILEDLQKKDEDFIRYLHTVKDELIKLKEENKNG